MMFVYVAQLPHIFVVEVECGGAYFAVPARRTGSQHVVNL